MKTIEGTDITEIEDSDYRYEFTAGKYNYYTLILFEDNRRYELLFKKRKKSGTVYKQILFEEFLEARKENNNGNL
jgi:hypothetical protein